MSRSLFPARVLSAATLSAMLLGTACSDSTAPVTEQEPAAAAPAEHSPAAPASPGGDTPAEPLDTATSGVTPVTPTISSIVQTANWVKYPFSTLPGIAARPSRSALCANVLGQRTLTFGGVQVTNLDYQQGRQFVFVQVRLWRYNSSLRQWQDIDTRDWSVPYLQYLGRTWLSVPSVMFQPTRAGLYTVTVHARWYVWDTPHADRQLGLNLATDFDSRLGIAGQSSGGVGYCYMP